MSFASEVKKELMSVELTDKCCEKADVIWRYTKTESNWLERKGYLKM